MYFEKYVKASDFLRMLVLYNEKNEKEDWLTMQQIRFEIRNLLLALQDNLDHPEIVQILLKHNKNGSIFIMLEDERFELKSRQNFIIEVFRNTLAKE